MHVDSGVEWSGLGVGQRGADPGIPDDERRRRCRRAPGLPKPGIGIHALSARAHEENQGRLHGAGDRGEAAIRSEHRGIASSAAPRRAAIDDEYLAAHLLDRECIQHRLIIHCKFDRFGAFEIERGRFLDADASLLRMNGFPVDFEAEIETVQIGRNVGEGAV